MTRGSVQLTDTRVSPALYGIQPILVPPNVLPAVGFDPPAVLNPRLLEGIADLHHLANPNVGPGEAIRLSNSLRSSMRMEHGKTAAHTSWPHDTPVSMEESAMPYKGWARVQRVV